MLKKIKKLNKLIINQDFDLKKLESLLFYISLNLNSHTFFFIFFFAKM